MSATNAGDNPGNFYPINGTIHLTESEITDLETLVGNLLLSKLKKLPGPEEEYQLGRPGLKRS